ncbi:hypothetical protein PA6_008_00020 [Aquipseudomonas alcaligenes NBRC 14159]|uniref:Thymidine phosphorylase n=1 Tax=Aquipseudomonas alcaligenes (strain ATCC 14909 / DSM 50342 / CCUG 1425 / JCM 20561 / NBRC 14159 / NCIMB 9945 / NCTC 10367 / 1577) TaxID=1215092 RepID=U3AVV5_AQUA1|nr:hypothetical protein PA6_008_00020 [Pseudomonas alcaligenes NBRC 14159]
MQTLERVAGRWFSPELKDVCSETAAGYWLADAFIRGVTLSEATNLTRFLAGPPAVRYQNRTISARRYPTGGISEKQALLLPPLMRALAHEFRWCSPFLVAAKLAHTGGTRDKLAVIPGFKIASAAELPIWDGVDRPVRYFSAGTELCPRDAMMYRIRGETGTVADTGLMSSSIMSKQIALPADVIILDILHGPTAFLQTRLEAEKFGIMCEMIGKSNDVKIVTKLRKSANILGRSIGSSTELVEASELLRGDIRDKSGQREITTSLGFIKTFAKELDLDPEKVCKRAEIALNNGEAFDAMLALFADHGADHNYIRSFANNPRNTVLGNLKKTTVLASRPGTLMWNAVSIADIANNIINSYVQNSQLSDTINQGGIELIAQDGTQIQEGDPLAIVYGESSETAARILSSAMTIT